MQEDNASQKSLDSTSTPISTNNNPTTANSKNPKKIFIIIAIVLILLVIFGIIGYLLSASKKQSNSQPNPQTEQAPTSIPTSFPASFPTSLPLPITTATLAFPSPTPGGDTSWKTYTNQAYGFSFQYPSSLTASVSDSGKQLNTIFSSKDNSEQLFIWTAHVKEDLTDERNVEGTKLISLGKITIDGHTGTTAVLETDTLSATNADFYSKNPTAPIYDTFTASLGDKPFDIELYGQKDMATQQLFNTIIASIKFTKGG